MCPSLHVRVFMYVLAAGRSHTARLGSLGRPGTKSPFLEL